MSLSSYFAHIKRTKALSEGKVFCFFIRQAEYPLLFFQHLIIFFKKNDRHIEKLDSAMEVSAIKTILSTISFSGQTIYWLEDFHAQSEKKQQELLLYLHTYEGPHQILFCSNVADKYIPNTKNILFTIIDLSKNVMYQDMVFVRFLVSNLLPDKSNFMAQLTMYGDYLSLDTICLLAHYECVLGKNSDEFFAQWATRIIDPTSSLFIVSQYFFNKKSKQFFRQWSVVSEHYPSTFWTTFWTDQLWRAYVYCDLMKQKKHVEAKKAQYKLPFSFINRDWLRYELNELCNAHHFLTTLDYRLKNGGSELGIEHFYSQFFEDKFQ